MSRVNMRQDDAAPSLYAYACQIELINLSSSQLGQLTDSVAINAKATFPELTGLRLAIYKNDRLESILPDSFLGGITCVVSRVPFPGLSNYFCLPLTSSILTLIILAVARAPPGHS